MTEVVCLTGREAAAGVLRVLECPSAFTLVLMVSKPGYVTPGVLVRAGSCDAFFTSAEVGALAEAIESQLGEVPAWMLERLSDFAVGLRQAKVELDSGGLTESRCAYGGGRA